MARVRNSMACALVVQDTDRLTLAPAPGFAGPVPRQDLPGGADDIDVIALGPGSSGRAFRPVNLDDLLLAAK